MTDERYRLDIRLTGYKMADGSTVVLDMIRARAAFKWLGQLVAWLASTGGLWQLGQLTQRELLANLFRFGPVHVVVDPPEPQTLVDALDAMHDQARHRRLVRRRRPK